MTSQSHLSQPEPQFCPRCQSVVPVTPEFVIWCPHCEWNINPSQVESAHLSIFERALVGISQQNTHALFSAMHASNAQKPHLTFETTLAYGLASGIYLIAASCIITGMSLVLFYYTNIFALIAGVFLIGMAWSGRPQRDRHPHKTILRTKAPTLYTQLDTMSRAFGLKPIDGVIVTSAYTAAYEQRGWSRRQYVWIGLPLWVVLTPQEQIALLAHELAHGVNGDPSRGQFLHIALSLLSHWHNTLRPRTFWDAGEGMSAVFALPFRLAGLGAAWLIQAVMTLFVTLLWRTMQRAEYWADHSASQFSGPQATIALLEKLHLGAAVALTIERASWAQYAHNASMFVHDIRHKIAKLPGHERERLLRLANRDDARVATTHPPTKYRIAYLQRQAQPEPIVAASADDAELILQELMAAW